MATFTNQSKNLSTWDKPYISGLSKIWTLMTDSWANTPETWQNLTAISWTNQDKN